jgi:diphthamide biosynthesis enzyme Dph1/Dph2-like protein
MKQLFIPVSSKCRLNKSKVREISKKLPKDIAITYLIQYKTQAEQIKKILSSEHNITEFIQVLGCSKPKISAQAILLVGEGRFHAISLARATKIPVYVYNQHKLDRISEKDIIKIEQKKRTAYLKFLNARKIGILISTKPGQQNLEKSVWLKNKFREKEIYFFICNNIDISQFENFPEIQSWVNTACPRIDMDDPKIINLYDLNS